MSSNTLRRALLATVLITMPFAASAQDSRYQSWSPPGSSTSTVSGSNSADNLLKDLKVLVDDAEKARAADRMFLRDLRDLMARYQRPWTQRVVFDDFIDGELTRNPTWKIVSGEYWVEQGYGLRSKSVAASPAGSTSSGKISKEELAISILGAVLQGANKNKTNSAPAAAPAVEATPAVLSTRARISNAFALTSSLSSWKNEGSFAFAVTQGTGSAGYRVVYNPKQTARGASLELVRVTSRGEGTIDSASLTSLEDQKNHSLEWTRANDGRMVVSLDGKAILNARDTSFRDPFDALAIINAGADVIVKSVEVLGVK